MDRMAVSSVKSIASGCWRVKSVTCGRGRGCGCLLFFEVVVTHHHRIITFTGDVRSKQHQEYISEGVDVKASAKVFLLYLLLFLIQQHENYNNKKNI